MCYSTWCLVPCMWIVLYLLTGHSSFCVVSNCGSPAHINHLHSGQAHWRILLCKQGSSFFSHWQNLYLVILNFLFLLRWISCLLAVFFLTGVPGAWLLWYGRVYNAAKHDRAFTFMCFFGGSAAHVIFCIFGALGNLPSTMLWGVSWLVSSEKICLRCKECGCYSSKALKLYSI